MTDQNCYNCINAIKVEALTSRMDKQESKTDNLQQMIADLKSMQNKLIVMMISALGITVLQLFLVVMGKK